ncbi:MAG: GNAT family N-acetyltransferase [Lachnospiraceae bacterium]|nr:GNAT family N-acetyltransferase [Lachnospiraceae bacterium]
MEKGGTKKEEMILRPITEEDTADIIRWRNSDHVRRNFLYQELFTEEVHLHWLHTMVETGKVRQFIMILRSEDRLKERPVGSVYLRDIDTEKGTAEYGIFIGEKDTLGRGYGTQACRMMRSYAKNVLKLKKLFLRLFEDNEAARKSYESAGFSVIPGRREKVFSVMEQREKNVIFMETELI